MLNKYVTANPNPCRPSRDTIIANDELAAKKQKEQLESERLELERKKDATDLVIDVLRKEAAEGIWLIFYILFYDIDLL